MKVSIRYVSGKLLCAHAVAYYTFADTCLHTKIDCHLIIQFLLQGDLQQLILVPSPESAYEVCKQFMPDCSKPVGKVGDSGRNGASSSNTKRQLPLSVTASAGAETLVYAQAPNGSFVVS